MAAVAASDKVEAGAFHRIECRVDGFAADHGNRCRRQAGNHIGVVGGRFLEMGASQLAVVTVTQAIDHRWVRLQQHADLHPTHEHAGNLPALLWHAGFLLHQRGHDQGLIGTGVRQVGGTLTPLLGQYVVEALVSGFEQFGVGHATHEAISVGKESSLGKNPAMAELVHDLAVAQAFQGLLELFFLGQGRTDLMEIPAFDQGQAVLHHFPALPQIDQTFDGHAGRHAVLAAVQRLLGQIEAPVDAQPERVLDDAVGFHSQESAVRGSALGHLQQFFLFDIQRLYQRRMNFPGRST